jgi:hypothetical protein
LTRIQQISTRILQLEDEKTIYLSLYPKKKIGYSLGGYSHREH